MNAQSFVDRIYRLDPRQPVIIKFLDGMAGIEGLRELLLLIAEQPHIVFQHHGTEMALACAIAETASWDRGNRTFTVYGLQTAEVTAIYSIGEHVEHLDVPHHGARKLFTTRQHMFVEAVKMVTAGVITRRLKEEVEDWGLTITGTGKSAEENAGFPGVLFSIQDSDGTSLLELFLDGWSGRVLFKRSWQEFLFTGVESLTQILHEEFGKLVEQLASPAAS